jgi:hypothetical protein
MSETRRFLEFVRERLLEEVPDSIRIEGDALIVKHRFTMRGAGIDNEDSYEDREKSRCKGRRSSSDTRRRPKPLNACIGLNASFEATMGAWLTTSRGFIIMPVMQILTSTGIVTVTKMSFQTKN